MSFDTRNDLIDPVTVRFDTDRPERRCSSSGRNGRRRPETAGSWYLARDRQRHRSPDGGLDDVKQHVSRLKISRAIPIVHRHPVRDPGLDDATEIERKSEHVESRTEVAG